MSDTTAVDGAIAEATEPEDDEEVEACIGEPMDPTYLERLDEETS